MKIALISFLFEAEIGGGSAIAVRRLAQSLIDQGHQVVIITTHPKRQMSIDDNNTDLKIFRFFPWNLYWVGEKDIQPGWKRVFWQLLDIWNPFSFRVVRSILAHERPDIVHVHKLRGLSPSVWSAARSAGVNTIIQTCHDHELMSPEGTLKGHVGAWAQQRAWFMRPYQLFRAHCADILRAATAPSQYILDIHSNSGFFRSTYTSVVPNSHGLTLEDLDRKIETLKAHRSSNDRTIRLLYLGRLESIKGIDILCEAFLRCANRFPYLYLDIVGSGMLEQTLQQRYGNHRQITFHGPMFGADKENLLRKSSCLIMPSICPEAFGIVIAEAHAHGVPVIASRVGAIPELIEEGRTGFLVLPQNINGLALAIHRVAEGPEALHQMAPACFQASRRFAQDVVEQGYQSVYATVA